MMRRCLRALLVAAVLCAPAIGRAQDSAVRFPILSVGDSTFTFSITQVPWVARGQQGIAVDPRRRDVLVARFRVLSVTDGVADALIIGQTQRVNTDHVALLREPNNAWYARRSFWVGTIGGTIAGFLIGLAL